MHNFNERPICQYSYFVSLLFFSSDNKAACFHFSLGCFVKYLQTFSLKIDKKKNFSNKSMMIFHDQNTLLSYDSNFRVLSISFTGAQQKNTDRKQDETKKRRKSMTCAMQISFLQLFFIISAYMMRVSFQIDTCYKKKLHIFDKLSFFCLDSKK